MCLVSVTKRITALKVKSYLRITHLISVSLILVKEKSVLPTLGLGTWKMGERADQRGTEITALRYALDLGYRLFDTAEMYGDGGAEEVVGAALKQWGPQRRSEVTLVSKVYPHNADRRGVPAACERSLQRLGLEYIDLYLLHWRGDVPLIETVEALAELQHSGRIRRWGVSNFDVADMEELWATDGGAGGGVDGAAGCAANQVYYSLSQRGVEFDLLPWLRTQQLPLMAYSPIDQGALVKQRVLTEIGVRYQATAAQIALAWMLQQPGVVAIPKAVQHHHLQQNWQAQQIQLNAQDRAAIDRAFAPPQRKTPLMMT
jgi:diketogulonate reductase-like aldo/keto reductase